MKLYLPLLVIALLTAAVSALLALAEQKTALSTWPPRRRQALYGVVFGLLSVCGTELGATVGGITLNESTAAPLCAGLIFGAPAGLIAGVIGGLERFFATLWGAGYYGRFAGSAAILLAGALGAAMRRYLFADKRPPWYYGLAAGILAEVADMLLLLLTRLTEIRQAFATVQLGMLPLTLMNGFAVMLALLLVSRLDGTAPRRAAGAESLAGIFQRGLLVCVALAFAVTSAFTWWIEDDILGSQIENTLRLNINDVSEAILDASDANLLRLTRQAAALLQMMQPAAGTADNAVLQRIQRTLRVAEVDLVDKNGIVAASSLEQAVGYDMASGEQSQPFLALLQGEQELVQDYRPSGLDPAVWRKYAGVALPEGGFLQVGYDAGQLQQDIAEQAAGATLHRHVGEHGFLVICDEGWHIVSDSSGHAGQDLRDLDATGYRLDTQTIPENTVFTASVYGTPSRCMYRQAEGYIILGVLPEAEAVFARSVSVYLSVFIEAIIFAVLFVQIYVLIRRRIVDNVNAVDRSLARITAGDLDEKVAVRTSTEFASLSDGINAVVDTLKQYIAEAASRIDQELAIARSIQASALPSVFPPYPERTEFDIWAMTRPAKEVGGDFYDFWLQGTDKLVFLVADVSGKSIPGAMFMMQAKMLLKSLAETGLPVEQVLTQANDRLCANNQAGMFVTAWMGVIDLETGQVTFGNAGHNPPLLLGAGGGWEYKRSRPGLVLAGMEGIQYKSGSFCMEPGDILFLYTDGVTEATDTANRLYSEERLQACLDGMTDTGPETLCRTVLADVDRFAGQAPQFDDITMLCLQYRGHGRKLTVAADVGQLPKVTAFVNGCLAPAGCPTRVMHQIDLAVDEIFSNIALYAYGGKTGSAAVQVEINGHTPAAVLTFTDGGKPFNPLEREDPDVTLPAEERKIGGLGIYIVKKTMDQMEYEYRKGSNRLRIVKKWSDGPAG